jgi:hypothetical protein
VNLKLAVLNRWTPKYFIRRELNHISELTNASLISLLKIHAPDASLKPTGQVRPSRTIEEERTAMARKHAILVDALADAVGRDRAVELGRNALFRVGQDLGVKAHDRLGLRDDLGDLTRAAQVLYRVLGIESRVEPLENGDATLVVERCALAREYSELTCLILSATDEGVVRGLHSEACMRFKERMTSGCPRCIAAIEFKREGQRR